jgi:Holliday junction resolvase RusA-like endonuclease
MTAVMNRIEFTVPGEPIAKGRPRSVIRAKRDGGIYVGHYTPDRTRKAEESFIAKSIPHRPTSPLTGPIVLEATFEFAVPESWPQWQQAAALNGEWLHVSPPDEDNLVKLLKDAFNGVFWADDRQVFRATVEKRYAAFPQTRITITELEQAVRRTRQRDTSAQSLLLPVEVMRMR